MDDLCTFSNCTFACLVGWCCHTTVFLSGEYKCLEVSSLVLLLSSYRFAKSNKSSDEATVVYSLKVRSSAIVTPISFTFLFSEYEWCSFVGYSVRFYFSTSLTILLHLMLFFVAQQKTWSMSVYSLSVYSIDEISTLILVSANDDTKLWFVCICVRIKTVEMQVHLPGKRELFIVEASEITWLTKTCCELLVRKLWIHFPFLPVIPVLCILYVVTPWSHLSKDFAVYVYHIIDLWHFKTLILSGLKHTKTFLSFSCLRNKFRVNNCRFSWRHHTDRPVENFKNSRTDIYL